MAKAMGPFRDSQAPSWLSGPGLMYRLNPPLIDHGHVAPLRHIIPIPSQPVFGLTQ